MNCIFCKIVNGELPSYKIFEDKEVISFLDIYPYVIGHVLVLPKKHSRWLWEIEDELYIYLMKTVKNIAHKLQQSFNTEYIQVLIAGDQVPHTHIHLLPRSKSDGKGEIPRAVLTNKPTDIEMERIAKSIRKAF